MTWWCPESGKATGEIQLRKRRVRCAWCGKLVKHVVWGEHIVVARHRYPAVTATRSRT